MRRVRNISKQRLFAFFVGGILITTFPVLALAGWSDWWSTPEQRALKNYESGNHEALIEQSPNDNWTALGQFQSEDFTGASTSFAKSREALHAAEKSAAAATALYNQGVSEVLSGEYEKAIEHFDEVLTEAPEFADAKFNRDIAEKLLELQKNPENSQDQDDEQGEEGEQGDEKSESSDSEQSSDSESSEEGSEGEEGSESESESDPSGSSSGEEESESSETESASEEQQRKEEEEAREALAAEAMEEQLENGEDAQQMMEQAVESEQPLTESEQATEQILRRIPDDPRGLLRRKLEQSHRNEFPEVRDAIEAW